MTSSILALDEGCAGLSWRMDQAPSSLADAVSTTQRRPISKMTTPASETRLPKTLISKLTPTPFLPPDENEGTGLIDIGANLLDPQFTGFYNGKQRHEPDIEFILERAKSQGVEAVVITCGTLEEARRAQAFVGRQHGQQPASGRVDSIPALYTTVGVHPTHANDFFGRNGEEDGGTEEASVASHVTALDALVAAPCVVAVGELGLDFDRLQFAGKREQRVGFEAQLCLAESSGKPLFLHSRSCEPEMSSFLKQHRHRFKDGVVHSFDGSLAELESLLALDLFVGLNGCSLRTEENLEVVRALPLERLLLETDAPWCEIKPTHAGFPFVRTVLPCKKKPDKFVMGEGVKGRSEPWMMRQVLEVVAGVKGVAEDDVSRHAHFNARRIFGIS
eukprot:CAMPEP_0171729490 /NCGR_PEP_ID=MMETSP0991-20121206/27662_1 /TAXON_ID=483369 /ORGANISM="non described non described, Strain CCMP2098" /LENGTH=389 /DNA_ID=CAMNT_0012323913 /DNA_START=31 /DNA_END=1200 /DNA_ORIENTATION=+